LARSVIGLLFKVIREPIREAGHSHTAICATEAGVLSSSFGGYAGPWREGRGSGPGLGRDRGFDGFRGGDTEMDGHGWHGEALSSCVGRPRPGTQTTRAATWGGTASGGGAWGGMGRGPSGAKEVLPARPLRATRRDHGPGQEKKVILAALDELEELVQRPSATGR